MSFLIFLLGEMDWELCLCILEVFFLDLIFFVKHLFSDFISLEISLLSLTFKNLLTFDLLEEESLKLD